jgi:iron-sulfur cluster assembly protein
MERAKMITITPKAVDKVKELLAAEKKDGYGLRVTVMGGGCSGHKYGLSFEESQGLEDRIWEFDGLKVYIDAASGEFLEGASVDYVDGLNGSGFKIENPNATKSCRCGDSFAV